MYYINIYYIYLILYIWYIWHIYMVYMVYIYGIYGIYIYIYIYGNHKKFSLIHSCILIHLGVVTLPCFKQPSDDCRFQVSFCMYNFFHYLQSILTKFLTYHNLQLSLKASYLHQKTIKFN